MAACNLQRTGWRDELKDAGRGAANSLCSGVLAEVAEQIRVELLEAGLNGGQLLDIGCWDGAATLNYASAVGARPFGVEVFADMAERARSLGVQVAEVDLEQEGLPWADNAMDVVVCNQVLEHLKNIWGAISEIFRVVKANGTVICSVPNLSSLHNRILLCIGRQPTSIRVMGPHVRGFTFSEFRSFLSAGFKIERIRTTGFHPLPPAYTKPLCRLLPSLGHTTICVCTKVSAADGWWRMSPARMRQLQTHYRGV